MYIDLPEDLTPNQLVKFVNLIKSSNPRLYGELLATSDLLLFQKLKILDNMLMDHPDLYANYLQQIYETDLINR